MFQLLTEFSNHISIPTTTTQSAIRDNGENQKPDIQGKLIDNARFQKRSNRGENLVETYTGKIRKYMDQKFFYIVFSIGVVLVVRSQKNGIVQNGANNLLLWPVAERHGQRV
ncbi:hypothetical protein SDJN03_11649, partial [Cucurbita argyrosperma subsp. sororia]